MDTCLLLPLFIEEQGTSIAERVIVEFTKGGELPALISELTCLEFNSVISKYVRTDNISKEDAGKVLEIFNKQCELNFIVLPIQSSYIKNACSMIAQLTTSLRSLDALHLAIANANNCLLATADKQLAAAAAILNIEHYFVPY